MVEEIIGRLPELTGQLRFGRSRMSSGEAPASRHLPLQAGV